MRGIFIISALILAASGYKMNPKNIHSHPPLYGRAQFEDETPPPDNVAPPVSYETLAPNYSNDLYTEEYENDYARPFSSVGDPDLQEYWHLDENRVITPSMALSNGFIPREIMQFRETFKVLRRRYPGTPLFAKEDFMVDGNYPELSDVKEVGDRDGRFIGLDNLLLIFFGGGGTSTANAPVKKPDHCELVCGNNNGVCMDCAACVATGGSSIGISCPNAPNMCCCRFEFSTNANTDALISFFTSPGFPNPMRNPDSFSMTVMIQEDVDQLLIEFLTFDMAGGPFGCSNLEYLEIISTSNAGGILGPDNHRLCGMNTDQHLYLDVQPGEVVSFKAVFAGINFAINNINPAAPSVPVQTPPITNQQAFNFQSTDSRFQLKITQIIALNRIVQPDAFPNCPLHKLRAPSGCRQYYSELRGTFMNFNFDGRTCMPPNLNYRVCFAHPENYCGISMSALEFNIPTSTLAASADCVDGTNQFVLPTTLCCVGDVDRQGAFITATPNSDNIQKYLGLDGTGDGTTLGTTYLRNQERYFFCGTSFGTTNFVVSEARGRMVAQVFSGPETCVLQPLPQDNAIGFKIRYSINIGGC